MDGKYLKLIIGLKGILVFIIMYGIVVDPDLSSVLKAVYLAGLMIMLANDFIRRKNRALSRYRYLNSFSMVINIAAIGFYLVLFNSVATSIYYIFPIVEVFLISSRVRIGIVAVHIFVYLVAMYIMKADVSSSLISYSATLLLVFLFRGVSLERGKRLLLSAELVETHAKLKEITIAKERTRIAQEMHDSIGHSLIALRMHIEYAENVIDANPQQARAALTKAHDFSQKSIKNLRKAVAILKDQSATGQIEIGELLNDMIESLHTAGKLKFTLNFDKDVESCHQDLKNSIYTTVRESVTNGLKHGKAQQFRIDITKNGDQIRVAVEDNGVGCDQIKKSHGLQGIEERIGLLNGKVSFSSEKGHGFTMLAEIPD